MTEKIAAGGDGDGDLKQKQQKQRRVCFSFAAYAKSVIEHLRSVGVPVTAGLSDLEFTAVEAAYGFEFPPDLRSILREGLPVGSGFPNWRSSSLSQLHLLLSLPITGIVNEISNRSFWPESFGLRPATTSECIAKARGLLEKAPVLVPIYRHFYIPSSPLLNGNPIFYIRGGSLRCSALDLADFFRQFRPQGKPATAVVAMPAWAAKSARGVEVWTALARDVAGSGTDAWRKEMGWKLREGGWREEEVREMMLGDMDAEDEERGVDRIVLKDRDTVMWHVRLLALALLRAGWSTEDVVYCMGSTTAAEEEAEKRRREVVTWQVDPVGNEISMEL